MNAPDPLSLTRDHLHDPLRACLDGAAGPIVDWTVEQMKGGVGNPVSLGLYRVQGHVDAAGSPTPFDLVLKVIQSPANRGLENFGEGDDPHHWNYWRREPRLYQSGLLDRLPPGLAAPACCGVREWDDRVTWIWLEAVTGAGGWTLADLSGLARRLGHLNGRFAGPENLPAAPFLGRRVHAQLLRPARPLQGLLFDERSQPRWEHPLLAALFPPDRPNPCRQFWTAGDRFVELIDRLPATWCHGDCTPNNFLRRTRPDGSAELVALDWALSNIGVLGQDLGQLTYGCFDRFPAAEIDAVSAALLESYLAGLAEMGCAAAAREVRLGAALTVLCLFAPFLFFMMGLELAESGEEPAAVARLAAAHRSNAVRLQEEAAVALRMAGL